MQINSYGRLKQSQTGYFPRYRQVDLLSGRKNSTLMDVISRDRGIEIHDNKLSVGLYDELLATAKKKCHNRNNWFPSLYPLVMNFNSFKERVSGIL